MNYDEGNQNLFTFFKHGLYALAPVVSLNHLAVGSTSLREFAPYALKINQGNDQVVQFFQYTAAVETVGDKLACIIFDIVDEEKVIVIAGHFIVKKDQLYDPISKEPTNSFSLLPFNHGHLLALFGQINKNMLTYPDYFIFPGEHYMYRDLLIRTQDLFMLKHEKSYESETLNGDYLEETMFWETPDKSPCSSLEEKNVKLEVDSFSTDKITRILKEPLTEEMYSETDLPITEASFERILPVIQPLGTVKKRFGDIALLHQQITLKQNSAKDIFTEWYAAYEEIGAMPFFFTVILVGQAHGHFVVAVIESDQFFIMATKRLYCKHGLYRCLSFIEPVDNLRVQYSTIHLPMSLPYQQVLTILETRQILADPQNFYSQSYIIAHALGLPSKDHVSETPSRDFVRQPGPRTEREKTFNAWIQRMLDIHFTQTFQNSLCEFGETPSEKENIDYFCLNVSRLWIHEILRKIYKLDKRQENFSADAVVQNPSDDLLDPRNFFRMTIGDLVDKSNLSLFGLSPDSEFSCMNLGLDGLPLSVCCESIPAHSVAKHINETHTDRLWKDGRFIPFCLFPSSFIVLTNHGVHELLRNCRSLVQVHRGTPYVELVRKVDECIVVKSNEDLGKKEQTNGRSVQSKSKRKKARRSIEHKILLKILRERMMVSTTMS